MLQRTQNLVVSIPGKIPRSAGKQQDLDRLAGKRPDSPLRSSTTSTPSERISVNCEDLSGICYVTGGSPRPASAVQILTQKLSEMVFVKTGGPPHEDVLISADYKNLHRAAVGLEEKAIGTLAKLETAAPSSWSQFLAPFRNDPETALWNVLTGEHCENISTGAEQQVVAARLGAQMVKRLTTPPADPAGDPEDDNVTRFAREYPATYNSRSPMAFPEPLLTQFRAAEAELKKALEGVGLKQLVQFSNFENRSSAGPMVAAWSSDDDDDQLGTYETMSWSG